MIEMGKKYTNSNYRKAAEQMLITHFRDKKLSYNPVQQMTQVRQIIVIDGVLYGSVRNAATHLRKSKATLSNRVKSDITEFANCYLVAEFPIRSMLCYVMLMVSIIKI